MATQEVSNASTIPALDVSARARLVKVVQRGRPGSARVTAAIKQLGAVAPSSKKTEDERTEGPISRLADNLPQPKRSSGSAWGGHGRDMTWLHGSKDRHNPSHIGESDE